MLLQNLQGIHAICGVYVCIHMYSFGAYSVRALSALHPYVRSLCAHMCAVCAVSVYTYAFYKHNIVQPGRTMRPHFARTIYTAEPGPAGMNVLKRIVHASATWVGGSPAATLNLPYPYQELSVCFDRTTFLPAL